MGNKIKTPKKILQKISAWRKANPDRVKIAHQKYKQKHPWLVSFYRAKKRCEEGGAYYDRGILFIMSKEDFKFLWFRDKAYLLKKPSINRKNPAGPYILSNCEFIEYLDNLCQPRYKRASGWDIHILCRICKRNDRPYNAKGLCRACYLSERRRVFGRK